MSIVRPSVAEPSAERRWVLVFAALVALLTSLPYLVGFYAQGDEWVFTGFVFGVEDGNSYIAKMLSGAFGAWKFVSPYSAYPQTGVWIYPLYIWLGKLAAPPGLHEQLVALFHMLRLGAVFLAVLAAGFPLLVALSAAFPPLMVAGILAAVSLFCMAGLGSARASLQPSGA